MKKLIFFSLALVTFISCKKVEEPCPHDITCRIYEKDSNIPVPFGKVSFYKYEYLVLNGYEFVQGYTADANGYFTVPSDLDCSVGMPVGTEAWHFSDLGWNEVEFDNTAESMNFYVSCTSKVVISLYDDPNITNANDVEFIATNTFFPDQNYEHFLVGSGGTSFKVKSYFPSQIISIAHYLDGSTSNDTIDVPALSAGDQFIYNYPY
jgi:hypothetical protein